MLKRTITLGELITASVIVIGAILGFWINTNVRLSALEINKDTQAENYNEIKASFEKLSGKLDRLNDGQNEIKITLQNKQDRK